MNGNTRAIAKIGIVASFILALLASSLLYVGPIVGEDFSSMSWLIVIICSLTIALFGRSLYIQRKE